MKARVLGYAAGLAAVLGTYGCGVFSSGSRQETVKETTKEGVRTVIKTVFAQDYASLNVIGGICALLAVGGILATAAGLKPPIRLVVALVLCSVGAWTLRFTLHEYMPVFAGLSALGIVLGSIGIAITHRKKIEKVLGIDLDGGGVGT